MMKLPVTPKPSSRATRTASMVRPISAPLGRERRPSRVGDSKPKKMSKLRARGRHWRSRSAFWLTRSTRDCTRIQRLRSGEASRAVASSALRELAADTHGTIAVAGFPERAEDVYNSAAVLADGAIHAIYRKVFLPNYGVFDEQRYFQAGPGGAVLDIGSERVGVTVCDDIWEPGPPASEESLAGATLILNISASPYHAGKGAERERMFAQRARDNIACFAFCGLVGGQDELVFDGHSCVIDHTGATIARAAQFREQMLVCDVDLAAAAAARLRDASHRPAARRSEHRAVT